MVFIKPPLSTVLPTPLVVTLVSGVTAPTAVLKVVIPALFAASVKPPFTVLLNVMSPTPELSVAFAVNAVGPSFINVPVVFSVPPMLVVAGPPEVSTPAVNVVVFAPLTSVTVPVLMNAVAVSTVLAPPVNETLYGCAVVVSVVICVLP